METRVHSSVVTSSCSRGWYKSLYLLYLRLHSQIVAGGEDAPKVVNALVSKWPDAFDMEHDIFVPGKVEKFLRELTSALRTIGRTRCERSV